VYVEHRAYATDLEADMYYYRSPSIPRSFQHWVETPKVIRLTAYRIPANSTNSNARIAGMEEEFNLSSGQYEWFLTIFYISYILFEPLGMMWKVIPPHKWAAFTVMGWALCGTLQAATYSWSGMMAARFFLGVFEACFSPGTGCAFARLSFKM